MIDFNDPQSVAQFLQQGQQATQNINNMPFTYNYGMSQSQVMPSQVRALYGDQIPEGVDPMQFYQQQGSPAVPLYGGGLGGLGGLFQTPDMLRRVIDEALAAQPRQTVGEQFASGDGYNIFQQMGGNR